MTRLARRQLGAGGGYILVVAAQIAIFAPAAFARVIDPDEGWYAYAAQRAIAGDAPYRHYFFPQTPLVPYVYGPWIRLFHDPWYASRGLSVLLTAHVGVLLYFFCSRKFGLRSGLAAVAAFCGSAIVFDWFVLIKTYALSTLLLLAAFVLIESVAAPSPRRWLAAGAFLGLAIDARLLFVAPVAAFIPRLLSRMEARPQAISLALTGGLLGLFPILFFLAESPRSFVWDTVLYQGHRSPNGYVGDFHQKVDVLLGVAGLPGADGVRNPQLLLLSIVALVGGIVCIRLRKRFPISLSIALLLGAVSLLPTPAYTQYFSVTAPFLIIAAIEFFHSSARLLSTGSAAIADAFRWAAAAALLAYVALSTTAVLDYARVVRPTQIQETRRVAAFVDRNTTPGERVLSLWPGYLVGTHALAVHGLENEFAPVTAQAVGGRAAHRYDLASVDDVRRSIVRHRTRLIVWQGADAGVRRELREAGYRLHTTISEVEIYELAPATGHPSGE